MSRSRSTHRLLAVALVALMLVLSGCGSSSKKSSTPSGPPSDLSLKVISAGDGAVVQSGDSVTVDYQGSVYATGKVFDQSYGKTPATFKTSGVVPGFGAALVGQKVGSKLIVSIPPVDGYGAEGNTNAGISGTDTIVFIIEIKDTKAAKLDCSIGAGAQSNAVTVTGKFGTTATPKFTKPLNAPKTERTIFKAGTGAEPAAGDTVTVLLSIYNGRTGKKLQSQKGQLEAGSADLPAVFGAGISCVKVGSRVVTTIPVKEVPGAATQGVKATDTLVLVTDVIKTEKTTPAALPAVKDWTDAPTVTFNGTQPPSVKLGGS